MSIYTKPLSFLSVAFINAANLRIVAFDPGKSGWKMDGDKMAMDAKGNPIWIDANGGENGIQGDVITRLNGDVKTMRIRAEKAEGDLKNFEGIDPTKARKAIEDISKIDAKKLIDAGEVDKVRDEISKQFGAQIAEKDKALATATDTINNMTINSVFAQSQFIQDNVAMPREFFEAAFRKNFKINNGKVEAFDSNGNPVYSRKSPGSHADPEEALEILVDTHPQKVTILKAADHQGSGNNGNGGGRGGMRTMRRGEFEKLAPAQQAQYSADVRAGKADLVD